MAEHSRQAVRPVDAQQLAQLQAASGAASGLPEPVTALLRELVERLTERQPVYLYPEDLTVPIAQAAALLGMTRSYLERQVDAGTIRSMPGPFGRSVSITEVVAFEEQSAPARRRAMQEILDTSQELGAPSDLARAAGQ